jgi:flagellar basal body-associated protein FliL
VPNRLRSSVRCWFRTPRGDEMDLLFIILIVVLVLALLGFFGRSYW